LGQFYKEYRRALLYQLEKKTPQLERFINSNLDITNNGLSSPPPSNRNSLNPLEGPPQVMHRRRSYLSPSNIPQIKTYSMEEARKMKANVENLYDRYFQNIKLYRFVMFCLDVGRKFRKQLVDQHSIRRKNMWMFC
jgi:hypothetical protein